MKNFSVKVCTVGEWKENSYLLSTIKHSLLIDPGDEPEKLFQSFFSSNQPPLHSILATHGHFDHVASVKHFKDFFGVPFGISFLDRRILNQSNLYRKLANSNIFYPVPEIDFDLNIIEKINTVPEIKIHKIPGHSEGSVAFELENCVFSGDILLSNEIGRTDLPGGNKSKLNKSVKYFLDRFLGYRIYPGHGPDFILDEKKVKFYLQSL